MARFRGLSSSEISWRRRGLIFQLVRRDFEQRFVGSAAGWLWGIIHPLVLLVCWTFVFSFCLKMTVPPGRGHQSYALYLFAGMLPWLLFSETVQRSSNSLLEHANLITKTVFPGRSGADFGVPLLVDQPRNGAGTGGGDDRGEGEPYQPAGAGAARLHGAAGIVLDRDRLDRRQLAGLFAGYGADGERGADVLVLADSDFHHRGAGAGGDFVFWSPAIRWRTSVRATGRRCCRYRTRIWAISAFWRYALQSLLSWEACFSDT